MLRIDGAQFTNKDIKSEFRQFLFDVADANKKSEQIKSIKCFVLLVYDDTNPYLKKVLKDDDFWSALDKLTKDRLAVITYNELINVYAKKTGKEKASDIPSWVKGEEALPGEKPSETADRILKDKYGPESEYNKVKKYFERKPKTSCP